MDREKFILSNDPRAKQLVDLVLDYSINMDSQDKLLIHFDPKYGFYADMFDEQARKIGAEVKYDPLSYDPVFLRGLIDRYDIEEWKSELDRRNELSLWCTSRVLVYCDSDPNFAQGISDSEKRLAEFDKVVVGPFNEVLYRPGPNNDTFVKWNLVGFPCKQSADSVNMELKDYSDFVYEATLSSDWKKIRKDMESIKEILDFAQDVHIYIPNQTDLHLSLIDRGGAICDGKRNMPDGEICYGPVEDSINGKIYFHHPSIVDGIGIVEGINLTLKNGEVKSSSAKKNEKVLEERLKIDEGAKRVGELGIGCNYGIKSPTLNTLFDEKIGGTIHLALGDSFRERPLDSGGGLNKSDIHWDIVCDLRKLGKGFPGGEIKANGVLVQKDGKWLI